MSKLRPAEQPLAYSVPDAGPATGYSESTIWRAVAAGDLAPRYANSKGVLLAEDLLEWLRGLPLSPP